MSSILLVENEYNVLWLVGIGHVTLQCSCLRFQQIPKFDTRKILQKYHLAPFLLDYKPLYFHLVSFPEEYTIENLHS